MLAVSLRASWLADIYRKAPTPIYILTEQLTACFFKCSVVNTHHPLHSDHHPYLCWYKSELSFSQEHYGKQTITEFLDEVSPNTFSLRKHIFCFSGNMADIYWQWRPQHVVCIIFTFVKPMWSICMSDFNLYYILPVYSTVLYMFTSCWNNLSSQLHQA